MQINDLLNQIGGTSAIAQQLGISERDAATGAAALLPAVLGGFKKQAQSQPGGVEGLAGMLGQLGGEGMLTDLLSGQPANLNRGNDVLGQIFGSKDVSRAVAQNAAGKTGLDPSILKKMLPMIAMLAAGYLSKQRGSAGAAAPASSGLGSLLGRALGQGGGSTGGLGSLLDLNGDGNPLDDIVGMAGKFMK
jgi:hypothetical protein